MSNRSVLDLVKSDYVLIVCADCEHEFHEAFHGFCHCGCTYPYVKVVG